MVKEITSDEDIFKCREAFLDLRPHIEAAAYPAILKSMINDGFKVVFIERDGKAVSVAGFWSGYKLHRGNYIYIDDLNTLPDYRKNGYAGMIMDWIIAYANQNKIDQIHLDSGVMRFDAHRFYLSKKFIISSHHFVLGKKQ
ncbi:MAG: aminoalkylphosphonic acid N-acetyltransferase [Bacteroidetes bacterium ADurb.Bin397]|jgi:GNAT superfamily N-acetyltransferase|nr:GNAT family N-acetyltransferase [Bacteroidia bacterium]OQA11938.1 MAG: aminoalkylphosphonic acid N-acetyltransferase [Bacteroidetes bacterium ADurb.Bin397]